MRYFCSLPNPGTEGTPKELFSDDPALIAAFIKAEDRTGRGVYECINPLQPNARRRSLDTVAELHSVYFDLDLQNIEASREDVLQRLLGLPFAFTWGHDSGSGNLHIGIELKDPPLPDTPEYDHAIMLWKRLAEKLAADPAPVHPAALIRCVGTHNTKNGSNGLCHQIWNGGAPQDITDLEALDDLLIEPLFAYKENPSRAAGGGADDPDAEHKPPIDIDARLAAMCWHGAGDSAINITQRDVTASLLAQGVSLDEATATVLDATRKCVAGDPAASNWDWRQEELDIAWSGARFINKNPKYADRLPDDLYTKFEELDRAGRQPSISKNKYGLFVRPAHNAAKGDGGSGASDDQEQGQDRGQQQSDSKGKKPLIRAIPFVAFDEAKLPPREWLYAKHYQRGQVTATIGPGGAGKSSLDLVEAIAMATARNLLDEQPLERCRVWIHNGDDDDQEVNRRVAATCRHYGIPMTELEGWLFATSKSNTTIKLATGNGTIIIDRASIREIISTITENAIDVVILEPLVTLHGVSENDNVKMNAVIHLFAEIADGCNCSIDICHHTRKLMAGVEEYSSDDGRGASAVRDGVRGSRILNAISREEARKAGIDEQERAFYFRVDRGKANYLPPAVSATWRKFENVRLLNDDQVGVVTAWEFQETRIALADDACEQTQAEVEKGSYRENKQRTPERWIGRLVAKHLKLNPNEEKNDWKIRRGIRDLENRGVIVYEMRKMLDDSKEVSYAVPGPWKRGHST